MVHVNKAQRMKNGVRWCPLLHGICVWSWRNCATADLTAVTAEAISYWIITSPAGNQSHAVSRRNRTVRFSHGCRPNIRFVPSNIKMKHVIYCQMRAQLFGVKKLNNADVISEGSSVTLEPSRDQIQSLIEGQEGWGIYFVDVSFHGYNTTVEADLSGACGFTLGGLPF